MKVLFAERLKQLRKDNGLYQSQLAEKLDVTQRKISYWETGMLEPDLPSLWKICDFFDVTVDYLIGRSDY